MTRLVAGLVLLAAACGRSGFDVVVPGALIDAGDADVNVDALVHVPANRAFVTSLSYLATFGGPAVATGMCQGFADGKSLGGTFVALVGDDTTDALAALQTSRGWEDLAGNYVADLPDEWLGQRMRRPLRIDENGTLLPYALIWIGARPTQTCTDWTVQTGTGNIGFTTNPFSAFDVTSCSGNHRIACLEVGRQVPVVESNTPGRLMFVTVTTWTPAPGGVAAADAVCQTDAETAGRTGTFHAALATSSSPRFDRVANPTDTFVNMAGLALLPPGADLTAAAFLDVYLLNSDSSPVVNSPAYWPWAGTLGANNCSDWLSTTGVGMTGDASSVDVSQINQRQTYACANARPLLCVQD